MQLDSRINAGVNASIEERACGRGRAYTRDTSDSERIVWAFAVERELLSQLA